MTLERSYVDYLEDILDAIEKVSQFVEGMTYERFMADSKTAFRSPSFGLWKSSEKQRNTFPNLSGIAIARLLGERCQG